MHLASCFAVALHGYAGMSNHVHPVLHIDPTAEAAWTDQDVIDRWVAIFPAEEEQAANAIKRNRLLANSALLGF